MLVTRHTQVELAGQIKCARLLGVVTKQISSKLFVYVASFLKYNALAREHQVCLQFDILDDVARSHEIIKRTLEFMKTHLTGPSTSTL